MALKVVLWPLYTSTEACTIHEHIHTLSYYVTLGFTQGHWPRLGLYMWKKVLRHWAEFPALPYIIPVCCTEIILYFHRDFTYMRILPIWHNVKWKSNIQNCIQRDDVKVQAYKLSTWEAGAWVWIQPGQNFLIKQNCIQSQARCHIPVTLQLLEGGSIIIFFKISFNYKVWAQMLPTWDPVSK